jgi:hypothetical protein
LEPPYCSSSRKFGKLSSLRGGEPKKQKQNFPVEQKNKDRKIKRKRKQQFFQKGMQSIPKK